MGAACSQRFCSGKEEDEYYERLKKESEKTYTQAIGALKLSRGLSGLTTLASVHFFMAVLLVFASLVPDFCSAPPAGVVAVPHVVWAVSSLVMYYFFTQTLYFGPYYQIQRIDRQLWFFLVILVLDLLAQITHLVLTIIELVQCQTPLCMNTNSTVGFAFLIVLVVFLGIWIILDVWLLIRVVVYKNWLDGFTVAGWVPGRISSPKEAISIANSKQPFASTSYPIGSSVRRPLLRPAYAQQTRRVVSGRRVRY